MASDFVATRSRRGPRYCLLLAPEQSELSDRVYPASRKAAEDALRNFAELLASRADRRLLGQTEFEVTDLALKIIARAFEAALNERKRGLPAEP